MRGNLRDRPRFSVLKQIKTVRFEKPHELKLFLARYDCSNRPIPPNHVLHCLTHTRAEDAMGTLTIRLDPALEKQLTALAKATRRQKSEIVRDALRRELALERFRALRRAALPLAEAAGLLTDEDVFRAVS
jgi:predicted transcriptional regulator